MDRNTKIFLLLAVAALFAFFFWRYSNGKPRFDWRDSGKDAYSESSEEPYGSQAAYRFLAQYFPSKTLSVLENNVKNELPADATGTSNYVFIGEAMYMDSLDTQRLLEFVRLGNTALISSKTIPFDLMFHIYAENCDELPWDDYLTHADINVWMDLDIQDTQAQKREDFYFANQNQAQMYRWTYIDQAYCCAGSNLRPLGHIQDSLVNFAAVRYGEGRFYLHTSPIALSNFSLLRQDGQHYASRLFSCLTEGNIYWDKYSRQSEYVGRRRNQQHGNSSRAMPEKHALTYILQQKSLAWAWYLLLASALVWLLFRAKRRQRAIPVLPQNRNTSMEFIQTIAQLHFKERNYQDLCRRKMKLFLLHLRERYNINIPINTEDGRPRLDDLTLKRLIRVSEVPEQTINSIFGQYSAIVQYQPTEEMMTEFHLVLEKFYEKAR